MSQAIWSKLECVFKSKTKFTLFPLAPALVTTFDFQQFPPGGNVVCYFCSDFSVLNLNGHLTSGCPKFRP